MQDICGCRIIHKDIVNDAVENALDADTVEDLCAFFKAFADPTRIRILQAISTREMCVCDIAAMLDVSESAVSHQLRLLRTLKLVSNRRDKNVLYYSVYDQHCSEVLAIGLNHLQEPE